MIRGLNAGFGYPLGADLLDELVARGVRGIRQAVGQRDQASVVELLQEAACWPGLRWLWCVEPIQVEWDCWPVGSWLELSNEPDLAGLSPATYRRLAEDAQAICAARGLVLWHGAISNLDRDSLAWLREARVPGLPVSIHRYPHGAGAMDPHPGFADRWDEVRALRMIVGDVPLIVSETGYHTAPRRGAWCWPARRWTDEQCRDLLLWELAFWAAQAVEAVYVYQLNDGQADRAVDRYGIRNSDGVWKAQAEIFGA